MGYFDDASDVYCQKEIEDLTDMIIWVTRSENTVKPNRPQDIAIQGAPLDIIKQYAQDKLSEKPDIAIQECDRIQIIGDYQLLKSFQALRCGELKSTLAKNPIVSGSAYAPMQCMLKGVCAQCLQWQVDPETGQRTKAVYGCSWQDQPLELIDYDNLHDRQTQNHLQETLGNLWLDYLFETSNIEKI
ncbi:MAG: hypothetical protein ACE365_07835 [Gammaproteobacteria bacterium]